MNLIRQSISWASELLRESGNSSPLTEVEQILMHLLKCRRIDLYLSSSLAEQLDEKVFQQLVHERVKGIPLQYLLGKVYFWCWEFQVRTGVFIARPETEVLVEQAVQFFQPQPNGGGRTVHLLDLGTGLGNIAITLTKILTHCKISAIELSETAIQLAQENALLHGVGDRIHFLQGDWRIYLQEGIQDGLKNVDGILANPPYIPTQEIETLDFEVQQEPREALDGGPEGLHWIAQILKQTKNCLADDGYLILEIGERQSEKVSLLAQENRWEHFGFTKDLAGIDRVFWAKKR